MGEPRLDIQAVESAGGRVLDFDEAPAYFSQGVDDPMFLIGEAAEVPASRLMEWHVWNQLFEQSRVTKLQKRAKAFHGWCRSKTDRIWFLPRRHTISHETRIAAPRTLFKVFRLSRLARCFAEDTWHLHRYSLDSPEVLGLSPGHDWKRAPKRPLDGCRVGGGCSYLLMSEAPGRADLLIVSWDNASADGEPGRSHNGRQLRTCSRVGLVQILNDSESGYLFSEYYPDLPTVQFRLG